MKLTAFTDYSLRLLMYVAVNDDRLVSIREISEVFDISRNHLMKIVHELGKGGYLKTFRGKNGGFRLGRLAKDINIGQLVRYTEDELGVVECFDDEKSNCSIVKYCMLAGVLQMALEAFLSVLDGHNLQDLIEDASFRDLMTSEVVHT
ncbi:MAG: Rrf2 family transcriptional regulator [Emcibacter sp.]|nr:Rrf2 family transcriptional regulator [Emcibacter sp.]